MTEMVKIKRENALSKLWQEIFEKKMKKSLNSGYTVGFTGQHHNPERQRKNKAMKELGMTGKQYRRHLKKERRKDSDSRRD